MSDNPFTEAIRKACAQVLEETVGPKMEKKCHELMEKQLDETVPAIVTAELHRLLSGGEITPRRARAAAAEDPESAGGGLGARGRGREARQAPRQEERQARRQAAVPELQGRDAVRRQGRARVPEMLELRP